MLLCWGADGSGQCGNGNGPPSTYVSGWEEERWEGTTPAFTWNAASAGDRFSVAVGADGSLWSWGLNDHGQLGIGGSGGTQSVLPVKVGSQAWTTASAGTTHALGVAADGTLWAWGDNSTGELGTAPSNLASSDLPVLVDAGTGWTSVAAGDGYSLALRSDGTLWAWGSNTAGQLGDGTTTEHDTPEQVGAGTTWSSVSAGALHAVARRSDGTIWAWGDDAFGELGDGATVQTALFNIYGCKAFGTQYAHPTPAEVGAAGDWSVVSAGACYSTGLHDGGADLEMWGIDAFGQYGDGSVASSGAVTLVGPVHDWWAVSEGVDHSAAIRADGSLWTWGANAFGQLGDATTTARATPGQIGTGTWRAVGAGDGFTVGVRSDGTLWAWGRNDEDQLGDGTTTDRHAPEQIGADTTWASVSVGPDHALALRSDGTLWSWGDNAFGGIGDGTTANASTPVQVGTDTWSSASAGLGDSLAVRSDGTLWAWGLNGCGELGDGTLTTGPTPHQIGVATTWKSVSAGRLHTVALRTDGSLWAWGRNVDGRLGDGTTTDRYTPVQIGSATSWTSVSAGYDFTVALRTDGTLWVWGRNSVRPARRRHDHRSARTRAARDGTDVDGHRIGRDPPVEPRPAHLNDLRRRPGRAGDPVVRGWSG